MKKLATLIAVLSTALAAGCGSSSESGGTSEPSGSAPGATAAPSPDSSATPDTAPDAVPDAYVDTATGLSAGTPAPAPASATVVIPDPEGGQATLIINSGDRSIAESGGTCEIIDGTTYVSAGDVNGVQGILMFEGSAAANPYMTWQLSMDKPAVVDPADFVVHLSEDGTNGTFEGTAISSAPNEDAVIGPVSGTFSCAPSPFSILGARPLALLHTNCQTGNAFVSAGDSGNAALLAIDIAGRLPDGHFEGAVNWRVDGVEYSTNWLEGILASDGTSANFVGLATDQDGSTFEVSGSFTCIGG